MSSKPNELIGKLDFSTLSWKQFEDLSADYINEIFSEDNTTIEHTAYQNDGGKDILLRHFSKVANLTVWIECKKHKENLGLEVVGKNVILVMSKHINKLIFLSASLITNSAKDNILYVAEAHNFEVAFLDGDNYKRELLKYPKILEKYFSTIFVSNGNGQNSGVEAKYFVSEFQEESSQRKFSTNSILYRNYNFYLKILLQNHSANCIQNIEVSCDDYMDDFVIGQDKHTRDCLSPMSDAIFSFYCESISYSKEKKLPNIVIAYKTGEEIKKVNLTTSYVRQESVLRFNLVGSEQIQFLSNNVAHAYNLCCNGYFQFFVLHGASGTGKSRMLEEIENKFKRGGFHIIHLDCSQRSSIKLLKTVLEKLMCLPSGLSMEWLDTDRLEECFAGIESTHKFLGVLQSFLQKGSLNAANLNLVARAILYLMENPILYKRVLISLDNIQDADNIIENLLKDINDYFKNRQSSISLIVAINTEVTGKNGFDQESFLRYAEQLDDSVSSMCNILGLHEFETSDANLFLEMAFPGIGRQSELADTLLHKSGHRPFDLITMFQYMQENQIISAIGPTLWAIPDPQKFEKFLHTVPSRNKNMINRRLDSMTQKFSVQDKVLYLNLVGALVLCKNQLSEEFLDELDIPDEFIDRLIQTAVIKYDPYTPMLSFYHDNLYRYCCKNHSVMAVSRMSKCYIKWTEGRNLSLSEKSIRFNALLKARRIKEAIQYGIEVMSECQNAYEMRIAVEIGDELHKVELLKRNKELYFGFLMQFGECLWESVDAEAAIEAYCELHELLPQMPSDFPVDELCKYYHEYINALFHIGQHKKTLPLLEEFEKLPHKSEKYQFIVNNRFSVFYFRSQNFFRSKEYIERSITSAKEMNNDFWLSTAYSEMAFNYMLNKQDRERTIYYFSLSNKLYSEEDDKTYYRKLEIANQKSIIELLSDNFDKAKEEIERSILLCQEISNTYMEIKALNILGITFALERKACDAIATWKKAVVLAGKIKNPNWIMGLHCNIGAAYILLNQMGNAKYNLEFAWNRFQQKYDISSISANHYVLFHNLLLLWRITQEQDSLDNFKQQCQDKKLLTYLEELQSVEDYRCYCKSECQSLLGAEGLNFYF